MARSWERWPSLGLLALALAASCAPPLAVVAPESPARLGEGGVELRLRLEGVAKAAMRARSVAALASPAVYQVTVAADDIQTPLVATASAQADPTTLRVSGTPAGTNRLVTVAGVDSAGNQIAGSRWLGVVTLANPTNTFALSPATTAVGEVWERWLAAGKTQLASQTKPAEVLSRLDGVRVASRLPHFSLVDGAAWADAAAAAGSLDPSGNFAITPATADIQVLNAPREVPADLWVSDPVSPLQTGVSHGTSQSNGRYLVGPVEPGKWTAAISVPGLGVATTSVTLGAGQVAAVTLSFPGWTAGPPLPAAVGNSAVVTDGTLVFVAGGVKADGNATDSAWVLDASAGSPSWQALPDLPAARESSQAAILGGRLYVVGGHARGTTSWAVYSLDVATRTSWSSEQAVPAPLTTVIAGATTPSVPTGLFVRNSKLYVLYNTGGNTRPPYMAGSAQVFDPANPSQGWKAGSDIPAIRTPRLGTGFCSYAGSAIVAGGDRGATYEGLAYSTYFDSVDRIFVGMAAVEGLDVTSPRWAAWPDLPWRRTEIALAAGPAHLYAAGGVDPNGHPERSVARLVSPAGSWQPVPPLGKARSSFGLVYAGGKLWAIAGAPSRTLHYWNVSEAAVLATVETFDPGALP